MLKPTLTAVALIFAAPTPGNAQEDEATLDLRWDPAWGEPGIPEYVVMGASAAAAIALGVIGPWEERETGGWLFDEEARDGLWLENENARWAAQDVSDALLAATLAYPVVVDSLIIAAWKRQNPEVAWKTAVITMETYAVTLALTQLLKGMVGRERPYGRRCGDDLPAESTFCEPSEKNVSFLSGHTSLTFAAAAVTCSHHIALPLYGGRATTAAVCATGFGLATTTGLLRILADRHYTTDVLAGAALGTTIGFLLPWLLYYRHDSAEAAEDAEAADVRWLFAPVGAGAGVVAYF